MVIYLKAKMSFIDKFLDVTTNLPREIIRLLKLYKSVEERSRNLNTNLKNLRVRYLKEIKEKDQNTKEILIMIDKNYKELLTLSDYKQELIKELKYILEVDFLKKLGPIIEEGQKECQEIKDQLTSSNMNLPYGANSFANPNFTKPTIEEQSLSEFNEKKKKSDKSLGIKTNRSNKSRIKKRNLENSKYFGEEEEPIGEENEVFCTCKGQSYGLMISCDHCKKWFHYGCVGIESGKEPKNWFCPDCQSSNNKKKKKKH